MLKLNIDQCKLTKLVNQGLTVDQIATELNVKRSLIRRRMEAWGLKSKYKHQCSMEQRIILSQKRKEYLRNNPELHPWKRHTKFKSVPCEELKKWLSNQCIVFIGEYTAPESDRNYSIDVAFPDKKIGIEVNGNQHYDKDGSLLPYYLDRQKHFENLGWKLYQLHYTLCFKPNKLTQILKIILTSSIKISFDYTEYFKQLNENKTKFRIRKSDIDPNWRHRPRLNARKVERPTRENLQKLICEFPIIKIVDKFNVSGNSIKKWCYSYGITLFPKGYWTRRNNGYSHEQSLLSQKRQKRGNALKVF